MKYIKLTNAATPFSGKPIYINVGKIISVFDAEVDGKKVTFIYGETKDSWQVKESLEDVIYILEHGKEPPVPVTKKRTKKNV